MRKHTIHSIFALPITRLLSTQGMRYDPIQVGWNLKCFVSAVFILFQPCHAQASPPLDLSARAVPGGVELLFNFSYHAAGLNINRVPAWTAGQNLQLFGSFSWDGNLPPIPGGGIDPYVVNGKHYIYNVVYPGDPSVKGTVEITYISACTFTGHCPSSGQPPQYTLDCKQPADFYLAPIQSQPQPSASNTTEFSGVGSVFPSSTALTYACVPKPSELPLGFNNITTIRGLCSVFSQTVNVSSCPISPPVKPTPIRSCQQCFDNGQKCIRSGGGFVCVGTVQ